MATARLTRWFRFNLVGLGGVAVQLGCLTLLVHGAGLHYLPATLIAVEAAVVHNFLWHQSWTWRDRPASGARAVAGRFARFQALNGAISLAVNSGAMIALAGAAGLDPVLAGLIAIGLASVVNFFASDLLVFARRRVRLKAGAAAAGALALLLPAAAAAGPGETTRAAWTHHEAAVDARYRAAATAAQPFFILDGLPSAAGWRQAVRAGEVAVRPLEAPSVDGGRIHHWAGAVFVPDVTVAALVAWLQRHAGSEARLYDDVLESRLLARDGDRLRVFMKLRRTAVITATFNTEHEVEYRRLGPHRASSRSVSVRIAELADAGTPRERERGRSDDRGFLWRLNAYWRFEQAGDGVIVECESVSLSRAVPSVLRPVAGPIIARTAREALAGTLGALRQSLITHP